MISFDDEVELFHFNITAATAAARTVMFVQSVAYSVWALKYSECACMHACERQRGEDGWSKVRKNKSRSI